MKQILGHIVLIQLAISAHSMVFAQTDPDTVSSSEIEQGWILPCQAQPTTSECEIEYED